MAIAAHEVFNRGAIEVKPFAPAEPNMQFYIRIGETRVYISDAERLKLAADLLALTADVELAS